MLDTYGLRDEDVLLFDNFYNELNARFKTEIVDDLDIPFEKFELFRSYHHVGHQQSVKINDNYGKSYLAIIQVEYTYIAGKGGSRKELEFQVWGFTLLPRHFGHVLIRPETYADKLIEIFTAIETDFPDDKAFSNKFYVLSEDKQQSGLLFNDKFRSLLKATSLKGFQLEVLGNVLAIGQQRTVASCDLKSIGDLVYEFANIPF